MKLVVLEPLGVSQDLFSKYINELKEKDIEVVRCDSKPADEIEIKERIEDADYLMLVNTPLPASTIENAKSLKMISVAFVGFDHVPVELCKEKGIVVSNSPHYCDDAVAELAIGLMLDVLRNITKGDEATRSGKDRTGLVGNELARKTVGIIGTGAIGTRMAEILKAFKCGILGYSRSEKDEFKKFGRYVSLEELLKQSDIISLHTPLNEGTKGLVGEEQFDLMKNSAILINTARGPVVKTDDFIEAMKNKKIKGAGIDVFDTEPPFDTDNELWQLDNVIYTPHVAFATRESLDRRADIAFGNVFAFLKGNTVNEVV